MKILKNKKIIIPILILTIIIIATNILFTVNELKNNQRITSNVIAGIIGNIEKNYPNVSEEEIISILNSENEEIEDGKNTLIKYGINIENQNAIGQITNNKLLIINILSIIILVFAILVILYIYSRSESKKIKEIEKYIEAINNKNYTLKISENSEDEFSNLSNELYKTTVMLKEQASNSQKSQKTLQTNIEDISHQLKTPLTSISIMLDNIIDNPDMEIETRQKFLHEINRQIEWFNWLVIALLKLSKIDSGTAVFTKKEINVEKIINHVIQNLAIPLEIKQQKIIVNGNSSKFIGDYNWQLEALTNIVKNCIEHTPNHKNIYIEFEENNFYTKITIRDEGVGIAKEDIKHIFERFYKGKNSSENSIGIGLALSKSIIERDNGYIICTSKEGEGTTFEIKYMK
mgnify:CR=1 FL=1